MIFSKTFRFYSQMPKRPVESQRPTLGFGLSLIRLYCPANPPTPTNIRTRWQGFQICLQSKDCRDLDLYSRRSYKTLYTRNCFGIEEGELKDIVLDTVIPLNAGKIYCITMEVSLSQIKRKNVSDLPSFMNILLM